MTSIASQPRIAIIGAGLGGLALHLTLHKRGIPATIYERDASPAARSHLGGSLDLHWTSGQRALRENGLEDAFKAHSRPEADATKICDATGTVLFDDAEFPDRPSNPEDARPEIDRTVLRQLLIDAVPPESIRWGSALTAATPLGDGTHALAFADGTTATCDVLVGADGAHSRVRPLVSPARAAYKIGRAHV